MKKPKIYKQSKKLSKEVLKAHSANNDMQAIVVAETQAGKTNGMIAIVDEYAKKYGVENVKVIFAGPSNDALRKQTITTFKKETVFWDCVCTDNRDHYITWSTSKKQTEEIIKLIEEFREQDKFIIFFVDEVDEGSGGGDSPDPEKNLSVMRRFFRNNNIPLCGSLSQRSEKELGVMVTASPAHILKAYRDSHNNSKTKKTWQMFAKAAGETYVGLNELVERGYIKDSYNLDHEEMIRQVRLTIREMQENDHETGYLIIRSRIDPEQILASIREGIDCDFDHALYNCDKKNIEQLPYNLSVKPDKPTIIFIKNALKRGVEVKVAKYIRFWYECLGHEAGTIQSVGRFCGYGKEYNDNLEIFCNKKHIERNLPLYEVSRLGSSKKLHKYVIENEEEAIQSGTWFKIGAERTKTTRLETVDFSSRDEANKYFQELKKETTLYTWINKKAKRVTGKVNMNTCSKVNNNSVAKVLLRESNLNPTRYHAAFGDYRRDSAGSIQLYANANSQNENQILEPTVGITKIYQLLYMDGPNKNFTKDWEEFKQQYPDGEGKWFVVVSQYMGMQHNTLDKSNWQN